MVEHKLQYWKKIQSSAVFAETVKVSNGTITRLEQLREVKNRNKKADRATQGLPLVKMLIITIGKAVVDGTNFSLVMIILFRQCSSLDSFH